MLYLIKIQEALKLEKVLFVDVRSLSEFTEATIPGAINMPILDDEERSIVGTIYKNESSEKATLTGVNFASNKLTDMYIKIKEYSKQYQHIVIFCWRGGMRSKSVCGFLSTLNISNVYQLVGGYKAYRKYVVDYLQKNIDEYKFIMLHGLTGVGKTHILNKLRIIGKPVLDLEYIAKNSGSVFGDVAFSGRPPSQKMFEAHLFDVLYHSAEKSIFVESESKRIGNVQVPDYIYGKMISGYHILIKTTMENRVNIILMDYACHLEVQHEKIKKAIHHLRKRLGNQGVDSLLKKIDEGDYAYVTKYLIQYYYDPLYQYSINKYENYDLVIDYKEMNEVIPILVNFLENTTD